MKIISIKEVPAREVYAISTSTRTFIADGLAHHNCVGCNMFGGGKPFDFEENLVKEIGADAVQGLKDVRHKIMKLDRVWYEKKIEEVKAKLALLTNTL